MGKVNVNDNTGIGINIGCRIGSSLSGAMFIRNINALLNLGLKNQTNYCKYYLKLITILVIDDAVIIASI